MRLANNRLVSQMQERVKGGFFGDMAYILVDVATSTYDEYNNAIVTVTEVPVSCSFTDTPSKEIWRDYADIESIEAEIRFNGVTPTKGNRVRLAGRFDTETMHDKDYEIIGIRDRDVFGWVCALKAVSI